MKKILLLLVFIFNFDLVRAQIVSDYFTIDSATQQGWAAGVEGGGSGINYHVNITMKKNVTIEFDSMWVGTYGVKLSIANNIVSFHKGSIVCLYAGQFFPYQIIYDEPGLPVVVPIKHEGVALIRYKIDGKIYYSEIATLKQLEFLAYP